MKSLISPFFLCYTTASLAAQFTSPVSILLHADEVIEYQRRKFGLAMLGFIGWRRRRKANAAV